MLDEAEDNMNLILRVSRLLGLVSLSVPIDRTACLPSCDIHQPRVPLSLPFHSLTDDASINTLPPAAARRR